MKITLDTNCLINHFDLGSPTATSTDEIADILRMATSGRVDVAVTTRAEADLQQDKDEQRRDGMMAVLRIFEVIPSVLRWDESMWDGGDTWADPKATLLADEVQKVLFPGLRPTDKRYGNKIRDVDHIVAHVLNRRDVFVTDDRRLNERRRELEKLGATVMSPAQCVAHISGSAAHSSDEIRPRTIEIPAASTFTFDCAQGSNFRVKLDRPATLALPQNPIEGTYRLCIEQGPEARGLISVSGKYKWAFGDYSEFMEEGDLTIYEIEIVPASNGFSYSGRPVFQTKKLPPTITVEAHEMASGMGAQVIGSGANSQVRFDTAIRGRAQFRVNFSQSPGRFRWRLHWSHEQAVDHFGIAFRLSAQSVGHFSIAAAELTSTGGVANRAYATDWSGLSDHGVGGVQILTLERLADHKDDTLARDALVHFIEIQSEPHPG